MANKPPLLLLLALLLAGFSQFCNADSTDPAWVATDTGGKPQLQLYFFWSQTCPHCVKARPAIEALAARTAWLQLQSLPLSEPGNRLRYQQLASTLGQQAHSVVVYFVFMAAWLNLFMIIGDAGWITLATGLLALLLAVLLLTALLARLKPPPEPSGQQEDR